MVRACSFHRVSKQRAVWPMANVYFFAFFTSIPINAFLFLVVNFSLILVAKNVSKLSARFEAVVDTSFGESTFYSI